MANRASNPSSHCSVSSSMSRWERRITGATRQRACIRCRWSGGDFASGAYAELRELGLPDEGAWAVAGLGQVQIDHEQPGRACGDADVDVGGTPEHPTLDVHIGDPGSWDLNTLTRNAVTART